MLVAVICVEVSAGHISCAEHLCKKLMVWVSGNCDFHAPFTDILKQRYRLLLDGNSVGNVSGDICSAMQSGCDTRDQITIPEKMSRYRIHAKVT